MMNIAVTGHRPNKLGGYSTYACQQLETFAYLQLLPYIEKHPNDLQMTTGMALGWDQAIAAACIELGIPFTAAVPFVGQEDRWPQDSRQHYNSLIRKAARIQVISIGSYTPEKMQIRNEWMVDQCDLLLALWNGSPGGTANCINYANQVKKPIDECFHYWRQFISREDDNHEARQSYTQVPVRC